MTYKIKISGLFRVFVFTLIGLVFLGAFKNIVLKNIFYPKKFSNYVEKYSGEYGLEDNLVYAVIKSESNFESNAVSHKDAKGLMQISEMTGLWAAEALEIKDYTAESLFNPEINIRIGCWYLRKMLDQFNVEKTALAAYNAGSGNVSGWLLENCYTSDGVNLDSIPFDETKKYVQKVENVKKIYRYLYS